MAAEECHLPPWGGVIQSFVQLRGTSFLGSLSSFSFQLVGNPSLQRAQSSIQYPETRIQKPDHRSVVGRRFPNFTSQGEFFVTCFLRWLHQRDWKVRQLPSRASSFAKSACSHWRSHHLSLLVDTPALVFLNVFIYEDVFGSMMAVVIQRKERAQASDFRYDL